MFIKSETISQSSLMTSLWHPETKISIPWFNSTICPNIACIHSIHRFKIFMIVHHWSNFISWFEKLYFPILMTISWYFPILNINHGITKIWSWRFTMQVSSGRSGGSLWGVTGRNPEVVHGLSQIFIKMICGIDHLWILLYHVIPLIHLLLMFHWLGLFMFHWVLLPKDWVSSFALHGNRTMTPGFDGPKLCWWHRRPSSLAWTVWDCLSWISSLVEICWKPQEIPEKVAKVAKVAKGALDRDRFDSDLVQLHFRHFCRSDFKGQVAESFLWSFQTSMSFV